MKKIFMYVIFEVQNKLSGRVLLVRLKLFKRIVRWESDNTKDLF